MASNFEYGTSVILKDVRLQWADIFKPGDAMEEGGTPKYKVVALFAKDSAAAATAREAMMAVATKMWGANAKAVLQSITSNSKAVRDGNTKLLDDGSINPVFKDLLFISAGNKAKPQIVGPRRHNGKFVTLTEEGRALVDGIDVTDQLGYEVKAPYRGCYVNLKVQFCAGKAHTNAQKKQLPNQVFARLEAVQFLKDGEAFGAGATSAEGFEDEEVEQTTVDENALF